MYAEWMKNISLKVTDEDIKQYKEKQKSTRRNKRNGGIKMPTENKVSDINVVDIK